MMPDPLSVVASDENSPGDGDYSGEEERCDFFLSRKKIKSHDRCSIIPKERKSISQKNKIRKFESGGKFARKLRGSRYIIFQEKKRERKEGRRDTFPSTLNFNKLAISLSSSSSLLSSNGNFINFLECRMYSSGTDLSPRSGINKAFEEFSCLSFARQKF